MITKKEEKNMKIKTSRIMIIIFILCIIGGVTYFILQKSNPKEEAKKEVNYETVNIITNMKLAISNFDSIHPYITKNREVIYLDSLIFEPLLTITEDYHITPCLAKEWSKVGEKSYIIKLKENMKWSNGESLTAQDVKFSIEEIQNVKDSVYYENVKNIQKVEVIDTTTINIQLKQEIPFFEYNLIFPIISKKESIKSSTTIPLGTGQFKILSIQKEKIELTQNEYWNQIEDKRANIKTITVNLYETMGEIYNAFKLGNIDFIHTTNRNVEEHIGSMGYGKKIYSGREYDYLSFNCKNSMMQFEEIRKAIELALDQEKIIVASLENKVTASCFPIDSKSYLLKDIEMTYKSNVTKAKKVLEEAGWKYDNGFWQKEIEGQTKTINITLFVSKENEQRIKVANEIKTQLEELGIKIKVEEITNEKYQEVLTNHEYEMLITGVYTSFSPDLTSFFAQGNLANYENEEINTILTQLNNITEEELRKEKYKRIFEIYKKEVPYIGLYTNQEVIAYSTSFRGEITPNHYNIYYNFSNWYRQE